MAAFVQEAAQGVGLVVKKVGGDQCVAPLDLGTGQPGEALSILKIL